MVPTVLVTGASGLLGRDVIKAFQRKEWKTIGTGLTRADPPSIVKLDLLDEDNIKRVLDETKPNVVVHCAANRFPDSCSADPDAATALNVSSTRTLTKLAKQHNAFLIYISTDYVFPGRKGEAPYKVTDTPSPPNIYGRTKLEGEEAVLSESKNDESVTAVVLRVPLLYGHCEENDTSKSAVHALVDAIYESQKSEEPIKIDDWALRFPTCTEDVGRVLVDISELYSKPTQGKKLPQILQFSAQQQFTKWQMVKLLGEDVLGLPMHGLKSHDPSKEEAGDTQRPYDSRLDTSVLKELGVDVSCQDFLGWWRRDLRAFRH
ncbi:NAD(P)-binding protein [Microthyrium microscopicum]|uniref:NAD(P)-binding protein n=1 Tax=Microthyrium microscopicum TaxID=703497 RepID=A0A6A6TXG3_9PEZI|nr:NAD(P)-binding protein [Microthyrium microscopicum]